MIDKIMKQYKNPALMCSFGKDSMVLLALLSGKGIRLPVIFFRQPFFPKKQAFAMEMIEKYDLVAYDYPPSATSMANNGTVCEVIRHYQIGQQYLSISDGNLYEPEEGKYLCGLRDLLEKPKGTFQMPWDVLFCGHKSSDNDPLAGNLALHVDIHQHAGAATLAYPLREWSDKDVWDYIKAFNIPFHEERYDDVEMTDKEDKSFNPDYLPCCTRCIDKNQPEAVECPKTGLQVTNMANTLRHVDMKMNHYGDKLCHTAD